MTHSVSREITSSLVKLTLSLLFIMSLTLNLYSSDLSDAQSLRERCEKESVEVQVPVKNFGDQSDMDEFNRGMQMIKLGKVKFLQSKYPDASESFNKYLLLQQGLYKSLAKKYLERTEKMLDDIAVELIDNSNPKIEEYLRLANQNFKDASKENTAERCKNSIKLCRIAKNYALSCYKAAGRSVPDQYKNDLTDIDNKMIK